MTTVSKRRARRRLLSWLPIGLVALVCVGFVVGAFAMQGSWWTDAGRAPSADQRAADGSTMFGDAGVDYLGRDGVLRVKVRGDAPSATSLGLDATGTRDVTPIVPVRAQILTEEGTLRFPNVSAFSVLSRGDRVHALELIADGAGTWSAARAELRRLAAEWGWPAEEVARVEDALAAAAREPGTAPFLAELPTVPYAGALVSARVEAAPDGSGATVVYTVARNEDGAAAG